MAKGRGLEKRAKDFTPLVVAQLVTLEQDLGGRSELIGLLTLAPLTPDLKYILGLLGDPTQQGKSLAEICAIGNILPGELLKHLEASAKLRGRVLSAQVVGRALPQVVTDVMKKAAPYEASCYACLGAGSVTPEPTPQQPNPSPGPCETCRGAGQLTYQPDLERQKLALEMGGMLTKGGGLVIQQNNTTTAVGSMGGGSLEQLTRLTDRLLYDEGEVIEADPADPAEGEG